jgi:hypothetical protein
LKCIISGLKNYISSKSVSYHYESKSRNDDEDKLKRQSIDFSERLIPFINDNINKVGRYIK